MTLPYKYRGLVLLVLLVVLLPWMAWRFALRGTFGTWRDCRKLSAQLAQTAPAPRTEQPTLIPQSRELILSGLLLDAVRQAAAHRTVQVAGYRPLVTLQQDGMEEHTGQLTLTGSYTELLKIVSALERTLPQCRLRSLDWHSHTDRRTRQTQLMLTLYVQQIVKTE